MKKWFIVSLIMAVLAGTANAQVTSDATLTGETCPGAACLNIDVGGAGSIGIQLGGSFTADLVFEKTINGTDWEPWDVYRNSETTTQTTTDEDGIYVGATNGLRQVRVRIDDYTSGSVLASAIRTSARLNISSGGGGGCPDPCPAENVSPGTFPVGEFKFSNGLSIGEAGTDDPNTRPHEWSSSVPRGHEYVSVVATRFGSVYALDVYG